MTLPQSMIKRLLEGAGIKPSGDQVEATTRLYNLLDEQMGKVLPESLNEVEPNYIQPTRPKRRRR